MPNKLRLGLIGAGGIAQSYAQVLRDSPVAEVVGVADVRQEAATAMAAQLGCAAWSSHDELAEQTTANARRLFRLA